MMSQTDSPQRRQYSRVLFQAQATLESSSGSLPCQILDLSLNGALVRPIHGAPPPAGTECVLDLTLDTSGQHIRMEARVAHHTADHIGLHCTSIDLDSITHLRRLMELNLGDADLLQRQLSALSHVGD